MDIVLERILSLIPKKPNGEFVHGALKKFANNIGLKSGNLISDWINGRSRSYTNYLYEIAAKYDVSVRWLLGDTENRLPSLAEQVHYIRMREVSVGADEEQQKELTPNWDELRKLTPDQYKNAYREMTDSELYIMMADIANELKSRAEGGEGHK